jgi:hypothetical protein
MGAGILLHHELKGSETDKGSLHCGRQRHVFHLHNVWFLISGVLPKNMFCYIARRN